MTASELTSAIWAALATVHDPEIRRSLTDLGMVQSVEVTESNVAKIAVTLTIVGCPASDQIERSINEAVTAVPGVSGIELTLGVMTPEERAEFVTRVRGDKANRPPQFGPDTLTRIIAVTSGKGGVGKSSVTTGLAVAFAQRGLSVGVVDADVFGFSIPGQMGLDASAKPTRVGDMILPPEAHGVKIISIGMFLGEGEQKHTAIAWRGPMLHRTIEQFLNDVWFGDLDILLLDLPPGTGDVALTVGQLLPHAEVLVVTTPQPAAADVAVRSGLVARQTGQRLIGVVENMSGLSQPDGSVLALFGEGGGADVAAGLSKDAETEVPLLAQIPLSVTFREGGDSGHPTVLTQPDDPAASAITNLAEQILKRGQGLSGRKLPVTAL